jgi:hypothetical protein
VVLAPAPAKATEASGSEGLFNLPPPLYGALRFALSGMSLWRHMRRCISTTSRAFRTSG